MTGQDDLGYSMLHKAIDIADKLGYIGGEGQDIDLSFESRDYYNSTIKTVWGLFQLDTLVALLPLFAFANYLLMSARRILLVQSDND